MEYLCNRGRIVILPDMLGVSESGRVHHRAITDRLAVAAANDAAVREVHRQIAEGELDSSHPAIPIFTNFGGGHSMGGYVSVIQQAKHRTYDHLIILGYTTFGPRLVRGGQHFRPPFFDLGPDAPLYHSVDRHFMRESFHMDDVPDHVVAADTASAVDIPQLLGHQTASSLFGTEISAIDVPLSLCSGERDVSAAPRQESSRFDVTNDVTLFMLQNAAHCQNFASTRTSLFERTHRWIASFEQ